jgi:hypothetical protein
LFMALLCGYESPDIGEVERVLVSFVCV